MNITLVREESQTETTHFEAIIEMRDDDAPVLYEGLDALLSGTVRIKALFDNCFIPSAPVAFYRVTAFNTTPEALERELVEILTMETSDQIAEWIRNRPQPTNYDNSSVLQNIGPS
jgi:succinate dehydrogenase flavin-adding protein (antitoxin of CptAB toxin-antitoxin module)